MEKKSNKMDRKLVCTHLHTINALHEFNNGLEIATNTYTQWENERAGNRRSRNYVKSITKSDNDDIRCILKARKILENVIKSEQCV